MPEVTPPEVITEREKEASAVAYDFTGPFVNAEYDHLIPLEVGGDPNDPANLWVEPPDNPGATSTSNTKDLLENELNRLVCQSLRAAGLRPYTFSPYPLYSSAGRKGVAWLEGLLESGLAPVTFGDVTREADGFRIISGDTIAMELSGSLRASRCVFVMDVDGIMDSDGRLIEALDPGVLKEMKKSGSSDATGGILLKVREAVRMASAGTEVAFVSGFRAAEFAKALKQQRFHGTLLRVPSRE